MTNTSYSIIAISLLTFSLNGSWAQAQVTKPYVKKPVQKIKSVEAWTILHPERMGVEGKNPVEKLVSGRWLLIGADGKPYIFRLFPNGMYSTTCGGQPVETGKMKAKNGKWSIVSEKGRTDKGTYTITDKQLILYSPTTVTTKWRRTKVRRVIPGPGVEKLERNRTPGFSSTYGGYIEYGAKPVKKFRWGK